jgi:beta-lactam-binding protein with PASTA domain
VVLGLLLASSGNKVTVPSVVGQTEAVALARLRAAHLNPTAALSASATVQSGLVLSETPASGSQVAKGTGVSILVSAGPGSAKMPAVDGLAVAAAEGRLRKAGFKPMRQEQANAKIAQGHVISTDPSAGIVVQVGSPVTVFVSSGPAQVHVPDLVGQSQALAEAALTTAGLVPGAITPQVSASQAPGTVLSQAPSAPTSLPAGGKVDLVVAKAPREVTVPGVEGKTEVAATAALEKAGFTVKSITESTSEATQVGHVLKQDPAAGAQAHKGATVTISIGMVVQPTPTTPTTTPPTTTTTTTTPVVPPTPVLPP